MKFSGLKKFLWGMAAVFMVACSNPVDEKSDEDSSSSGFSSESIEEESSSSQVADIDTAAVDSTKKDTLALVITDDPKHGGMKIISVGDGVKVVLGTNDPSAKANEKPEMTVTLDYDFSIGMAEVTCSNFYNAMDTEGYLNYPVCVFDHYPVSNVTFFDAVLYMNARSKASGLDTVYTYFDRTFGDESHCVGLEGLVFHPEADGFRLPTEAEWTLIASLDWDPANGWNASNSDKVYHNVCFKSSEKYGFCDFAGNVMEWTNDWLAPFKDTAVVNFVGAPRGNSLGEKVVKGGSFVNEVDNIHLYNRGNVYPVAPTSKSAYLGFRFARGAIPHPTWLDNQGRVASSQVYVRASLSTIREKTGTFHTKLAFRNDETGNLAYVNFAGSVSVVEVVDTIPVYHPDISPDGSKVAFCTGAEGVKGTSQVYVRNLDETGSGLVKLDVKNASIPRWHVSPSGDTSIVYVDDSGDNSDEGEFLSKSTWSVSFANGKFGKPRKLFAGAYHGGVSADGKMAVTGSKLLRVNQNGEESVWYNKEQACNASLSKDSSLKTLFLDFGGATGIEFSGSDYKTHERILVMDQEGSLVQSIPAPKGYTYDHSEWANHDDLAVATLVNKKYAHTKIVLVDLKDSSVVDLAEGAELWHPCLWVKEKKSGDGSVDFDSAGVYLDGDYSVGEKTMSMKMRMFWNMRDSVELYALGSSRTERGVVPKDLSVPSLNMGHIGDDLWGDLYLLEHYLLPHATNMKYLVLEISPDLMRNTKHTRWTEIFDQAAGYYYDRRHDFWKDGVSKEFIQAVNENVTYSYEDSLNYIATLGFYDLEAGGWGSSPEIIRDSILSMVLFNNYYEVTDSVVAFIENTKDMGFQIIAVVYPESPLYATTGAFSRHGVQRSVAMGTLALFDSLAQVYPHFTLMDENKFGDHDYTDDMAFDMDHLAGPGAKQFTRRLDSLIQKMK